MFRASQLIGLTKRRCLEIQSMLEDRRDDRRDILTNTGRFMSFDRSDEFLDAIHADAMLPMP